jgi:nitroreductase
MELDCEVKNREYHLFDTGIGFAFMILKATDMGLVVHPMAGYDEEKVKKALSIPDDMTVITVAAIGKKTKEIRPFLNEKQVEQENNRPLRKPQDEIAFYNTYSE